MSRDPNVTFGSKLSETVTIFDDDQATVSINANDKLATEDPIDNGQFTLTLSGTSDTDTVIKYTIATGVGQATNGGDYKLLSGTATILAGKTTTTIDVEVIDDSISEPAETVTLTLASLESPTNADIAIDSGANTATVTIGADNDAILISVFNNGNGTEGGANGSYIVKITKADGTTPVGAPAGGLTVNYGPDSKIGGGTAVGGPSGDYVALSGSIFIAPGNTTGLIDVAVIDDATVEATETVNIELFSFSAFTGASFGTAKASLNIVDNDKATYSINSITVNENVGTATLTVSLSNPVDISTTVDVKYADVTATGGGVDYDSTTDTVVFAAGKVAPQTVTVSIVDDSLTETLEVFQTLLSSPTAMGDRAVSFTNGTVGIQDNDPRCCR